MNDAMFAMWRGRCALQSGCCAVAGAALLSGCALIHHDSDAVRQVEAASVQVSPKLNLPTGDWPSDKWWLEYDDPQLTAFIDRALVASPTMALARQRVAQAQAQAELAVAAAGPQLAASGAIDRERVSSHGFLSA